MVLKNKSTPPPRAPWRSLFREHISRVSPTEFSFSTVHRDPITGKTCPRVRTCIFRNFWAEMTVSRSAMADLNEYFVPSEPTKSSLKTETDCSYAPESTEEEHDHDGGERSDDMRVKRFGGGPEKPVNEAVFESDLFTFTTDVRMAKVGDLVDPSGAPGGDVEALFWLKHFSTQWRVKGKAFVIGGDPGDKAEKKAREEIQKGMRQNPGYSRKEVQNWSWEKEITAQFANLSPLTRGSFKNPPPGSSKSASGADPTLRLGQKVYDLFDPVARSNFRVVVIRPEEVEIVDLTEPEAAMRTRWSLVPRGDGHGTEWKEEELWP
ncbi:pyridoxal 5'-phosphate synthase [Emydomyces testavorans]|uniref:Pyridoxal 5'-phosphate synthase n=1 Tax=Emydomyces testavorans TaxID=2070801 RepID=A0AAF0DFK6_9EURO|nr:pyridoxal 5'-phosphate synthase [Emydomyces testavorans]